MKRYVVITAVSAILALIPHPAGAVPASAPPSHPGDSRVDAIADCVDFRRPLLEVRNVSGHADVRSLDRGITVSFRKPTQDLAIGYDGAPLATIRQDDDGNTVVHGAGVFSDGDPSDGGIGRIFAVRDGDRCANALPQREVTFRPAKPR